jgi:hypothetical protein
MVRLYHFFSPQEDSLEGLIMRGDDLISHGLASLVPRAS